MGLNALLISNSKHSAYPGKYLAYCEKEIKEHFSDIKQFLLLPYAEPGDMDKLIAQQREGAMLQLWENHLTLRGYNTARLFRPERMMADYMPLEEYSPCDSLDFLPTPSVRKPTKAQKVLVGFLRPFRFLGSLLPSCYCDALLENGIF